MTKLAFLTDMHFHARNSQYFQDKLFKFLENIFFPYIEEHDIKDLLILGDTWDKRKHIDFNILHDVYERFFNRLQRLQVAVKIIYGNHDVYFKNTNKVNSIDLLLSHYDNVEIVDTRRIIDYNGYKVGMISWINPSILQESIEWLKNVSVDLLCGHFEINGFELVKGHVCENGFSRVAFQRFDKVFSGHFHVKATSDNIYYLGNPLQTNWGDYGLEKGFHVLDTETGNLDFIPNGYVIYEKIDFTHEINLLEFDYDFYSDKIVQINVDASDISLKAKLDLFFDKMQEVSFEVRINNLNKNQTVISETILTSLADAETVDTLSLIRKYVGELDISLDKNIILEDFRKLYTQAMDISLGNE